MKFKQSVTSAIIACLILFSQHSFAYEADKPVEVCKIPKLLEFNLPEYAQPDKHEVAPESEFSFKVNGRGADPKKIKVTAKGKVLPLEIDQNSSFISVKGKLPAEFTGQFVRFDALVGTDLGCRAKDGWLIKVAGTTATSESVKAEATTEAIKSSEPGKTAETSGQ